MAAFVLRSVGYRAELMIHTHGNLSITDELKSRLLQRARTTLEHNILQGNDYPWSPRTGICPSPHNYRGIWNWDAAFTAIAVSRWNPDLARDQIAIFLDAQLESGALPDVLFEGGHVVKEFGKPPVMPWAAAIIHKRAPNIDFLKWAYPKFVEFEKHWRLHRGGEEEGLFHYDAITQGERRDEHIRYESGWDTSVRWDNGIWEMWPVDLNCYMVLVYRALSEMASALGKHEEANSRLQQANTLEEKIEETMWNPVLGSYVDVNRVEGTFSEVLTPASFMPLYARFADPERAKRMNALALDPNKFFPGMPSVAYDDPAHDSDDYWRGPTWFNLAYFAAKGLQFYGFHESADLIRLQLLRWLDENHECCYEYYDSRSGQGHGAREFSWTAAFATEFLMNWDSDSLY